MWLPHPPRLWEGGTRHSELSDNLATSSHIVIPSERDPSLRGKRESRDLEFLRVANMWLPHPPRLWEGGTRNPNRRVELKKRPRSRGPVSRPDYYCGLLVFPGVPIGHVSEILSTCVTRKTCPFSPFFSPVATGPVIGAPLGCVVAW